MSSTCCATWFRFSNGSVVVITNCTGKPELPGSAGNWNAATRAPAMWFHLACKSCWIWCAERLRVLQSLTSMPPMPEFTVGTPVIWNICLYSGMALAVWNTWSA